MKNGLDWLVSFEGFVDKPVALINTSPRARHAYDALREVLQTMSARIVLEASVTLPLLGAYITEEAMVSSSEVGPMIRGAMTSLAEALAARSEPGPNFPLG